jgi:fermentation-respiration switch protein FrsA (DUF1100 family)
VPHPVSEPQRPILFVTGEHAHSRYFSEDASVAAAEPKELYVVPTPATSTFTTRST